MNVHNIYFYHNLRRLILKNHGWHVISIQFNEKNGLNIILRRLNKGIREDLIIKLKKSSFPKNRQAASVHKLIRFLGHAISAKLHKIELSRQNHAKRVERTNYYKNKKNAPLI